MYTLLIIWVITIGFCCLASRFDGFTCLFLFFVGFIMGIMVPGMWGMKAEYKYDVLDNTTPIERFESAIEVSSPYKSRNVYANPVFTYWIKEGNGFTQHQVNANDAIIVESDERSVIKTYSARLCDEYKGWVWAADKPKKYEIIVPKGTVTQGR